MNINNKYITNLSIYKDLEFFSSNDIINKNNNIFNKIDKTYTSFGSIKLKQLIMTPLNNINDIKTRQNNIKNIQNNKNYNLIKNYLTKIKSYEKYTKYILFEKYKSKETQKLFSNIYFKKLDFINNYPNLLHIYTIYNNYISPIFETLSPLSSYFTIISMFNKFNIKLSLIIPIIKVTLKTMDKKYLILICCIIILYILMYCYSTYKTIYQTINNIKILNYIKNILICNSKTLYYIKHIAQLLNQDNLPSLDFIKHYSYYEQWNITNIGNILYDFLKLSKNKHKLYPYIKYLSIIDSYVSIIQLTKNKNINYTNYIESDKPIINVTNLHHPLINKNIPNSININKKKNILITGNNAAGKSIFIKSLLISVLLSQTLTISFADNLVITPFTYINSHINIPDTSGKESLFQAEMNRMIDTYNSIKNSKKNEFHLLVIDELFSSTNPKEAISASYSICKHLSTYNNSIKIITTHYDYLTKLNKWSNYYFQANIIDNQIIYDYKLKKGKCNNHIALKILSKKIKDDTIIKDATKIYKKLT